MITYDKIIYNQTNWRDDAVGKDKNVARGDFVPVAQTDDEYRYRVSRAIKYLRQFNDKYNDGRSEVLDRFSVDVYKRQALARAGGKRKHRPRFRVAYGKRRGRSGTEFAASGGGFRARRRPL